MTDMMELRHYIDTFSSLHTGKPYFHMQHEPFWRTPIIMEQVVNIIRQFTDVFKSVAAKGEIKKKLRSIL